MIAAVHPLATSPEPPSRAPRLLALDLMRGVVMLLMIVDHASLFFNAGRVANDGASMWQAGSALPLPQFLTRFVTHLCAPTFLFLAGAAVAISTDRRTRAGASPASIDRDLLVRGAFIVALDLVYMSTLAGFRLMQVLYAIGVSMMLMPLLRRLPDALVLASSAAFLVLGELLTTALWSPPENSGLLVSLTLAPYRAPQMAIVYPFVPWLCLMALGHVFARRLLLPEAARAAAPRHVLLMGLSLLALFAAVRGFNGYGNMLLPSEDGSLVQWLHVSKYPPALAYVALELGLLALCLAPLLWLERRGLHVRRGNPVLVFGQTALFFYVAHFTLLGGASQALAVPRAGLSFTYGVALGALLVLYPLCLGFRALKTRHPRSVLRYV
jgi:uncharacterized membrane protein